MESIAVVVVVTALLKGLERWATPLMIRFRPRGVIDPSGIGLDVGTATSAASTAAAEITPHGRSSARNGCYARLSGRELPRPRDAVRWSRAQRDSPLKLLRARADTRRWPPGPPRLRASLPHVAEAGIPGASAAIVFADGRQCSGVGEQSMRATAGPYDPPRERRPSCCTACLAACAPAAHVGDRHAKIATGEIATATPRRPRVWSPGPKRREAAAWAKSAATAAAAESDAGMGQRHRARSPRAPREDRPGPRVVSHAQPRRK